MGIVCPHFLCHGQNVQNVRLKAAVPMNGWKRISMGSWRPTGDSSTYSELELDVHEIINNRKIWFPPQVSFLHLFGVMMARAIEREPKVNAVVRLGRVYPRESIDLFFHVLADGKGEDLSGVVVRDANKLSPKQFAAAFDEELKIVRGENDAQHRFVKDLFSFVPGFFSRAVLAVLTFFLYSLNFWSPKTGATRDAFGSIMITNAGQLGIDLALCPIAPFTRIPMVVVLGAVKLRPIVHEGVVKSRYTVRVGLTTDHRLLDGYHVGKLHQAIQIECARLIKEHEQHDHSHPSKAQLLATV